MSLNFAKSSFWILIISNSANIAQYLSQLILGRNLEVGDYGIFNAVNSLSLIVVTFVAVIPVIVSKYMIFYQDDIEFRNYLLQRISLFIYTFSFFLVLLLLLLSEQIRIFLKIESLSPIYIFIIIQ